MKPATKQALLCIGDILLLYAALLMTLIIRYRHITDELIDAHLIPFSIIFILWLASFYVIGLYDIKEKKDGIRLVQEIIIAVITGAGLSIIAFYLIPYFSIAPKTNLGIFVILFAVAQLGWRLLFRFVTKTPQKIALIIGDSPDVQEFGQKTLTNPHLGYKIAHHIADPTAVDPSVISDIINQYAINTIIIVGETPISDAVFDELYLHIINGVEMENFTTTYETLFKKVPLTEVEQTRILTEISRRRQIYDAIKRPTEWLLALFLLIILLIPMAIIWLLIKTTSRGSGFYTQVRVGKHNAQFTLYKFRTMTNNAEADGPQWAATNDPRTTSIGKILRYTHLDELPQLINILAGHVSFVGPRPERPEFVRSLEQSVPYFEIRHLVKPGITGWAQINYRYGASIEDAKEKVRHDIYYIKHRSPMLDVLILLRTLKMLAFNHK